MTTSAPAPLTPSDSDLRDFAKIMIDIPRLMGSQFNAIASRNPLAWMIGHKLWYRAWHQVPAGSLPDDDDQLCHLAELGFDMRSFRKAKAAALHGWFRCADGRLYHSTVAEAVNEAWQRKLEQRWRTECARVRKANERNGTDNPTPTWDQWLAARSANVTRDTAPMSHVTAVEVTRDEPPPSHECLMRNGIQETGTGTVKEKDSVASAPPNATTGKPWLTDPDFRRFWESATPDARRRTSQEKTWRPFETAARAAGGRAVIADAYARYLVEDKDVERTGGPGLQRWLADGRWEHWLPQSGDRSELTEADWQTAVRLWRSAGDWLPRFGPRPGEPGCRAPTHLILAEAPAIAAGGTA